MSGRMPPRVGTPDLAAGTSADRAVMRNDASVLAAPPRLESVEGGCGEYRDLSDLRAADREEGWDELLSTTHLDVSVRVTPSSSGMPLQARVRRWWIEDLALVDAECDPSTGARGRLRADGQHVGVMVARRGPETRHLATILSVATLGSREDPVAREEVEFTAQGVAPRGWCYPAGRVDGGAPCVVVQHGFAAVKEVVP